MRSDLESLWDEFMLIGFAKEAGAAIGKKMRDMEKEIRAAHKVPSFEDIIESLDEDIMAAPPTRKEEPAKNYYKSTKREQKYLIISDLHIPFHVKEVEAVLDAHANKGYDLVLDGDILDCHNASSFTKDKNVPLSTEINIAKSLLRKYSTRYGKIYLVSGNHERRLSTYLRKRVAPEIIELIQDDLLENIVSSLRLKNVYYQSGDINNWWIQIDNVIIGHPDTYKRGILQTVLAMYKYFDARNTDADVYICAHTHAAGMAIYNNRVICEIGCGCEPQDYSMSGGLAYMPQTNSYCTMVSRDGRVEYNDIRIVQI